MMMMARGGAYLVSQGRPVYGIPRSFRYLGGSEVWWIPVVVAAVIAGVLAAVLTFTRYGRHLLATGGNITAARLSGVRVDGVRLGAYAVCGLLAGFAGLMLASRTSSGDPNAGMQMELDVIAACVIGGASLMGGEGSVLGAVAGALIMEVLRNVCNLVDLDVYWQPVLIGALIIALVSYDTWRRRRAGLLKE
jgi:ribose/xylose/arabinose/galactoside ABC-type transport system permease subunit